MKDMFVSLVLLFVLLNSVAIGLGTIDGFHNPKQFNCCNNQPKSRLHKILFPAQDLGCVIGKWLSVEK